MKYMFKGTPIAGGKPVYGDLIQLHDGRNYVVNHAFGACLDAEGNFINTQFPYVIQVKPETVELFKSIS